MTQGSYGLSEKQKVALGDFLKILETLKKQDLPLDLLIESVIDETNYLNYLKEDPMTFDDKKDNLFELVNSAKTWLEHVESPTLNGFLEDVALKTTKDTEDESPSVKLMTLHNSKGLEFKVVFLVGMEEDLFPHINAKDSMPAIEEERRLCYVGMTRARESLYMSSAGFRFFRLGR
jgi:DNA helicase-2/ATP-dependent DNA helicase PcrA